MIEYKSHFGNWKEVTLDKVLEIVENALNGGASAKAIKDSFDRHYKGITWEELMKAYENKHGHRPSNMNGEL